MQFHQPSVTAGYRVGVAKMRAEFEAFKAEYTARLDAAVAGLRQTRLELLHYKSLVVQGREQRAEIDRLRQLTKAQMAQRESDTLLH